MGASRGRAARSRGADPRAVEGPLVHTTAEGVYAVDAPTAAKALDLDDNTRLVTTPRQRASKQAPDACGNESSNGDVVRRRVAHRQRSGSEVALLGLRRTTLVVLHARLGPTAHRSSRS